MKIPVEKSIYRRVYLQLRTGILPERPLFYDAIRLNPPPTFTRRSTKLPNLVALEDRLMKEFQRKYPYHYEDFVSDNYQSTRYVAYNFAKKQAALMKQGMPQDKAFAAVEKEYLAERDAIDRQLDATFDESKNGAAETKEEPQEAAKSDSDFHTELGKSMVRELDRQKYENIHTVIDHTIQSFKRKRGDHLIIEKLEALEHYRLDHVDEAPKASLSMEGVLDDDDELASEAEENAENAKKVERADDDEEL
ncbi:hypothetical protein WA556_000611 [Blastocystis sp. ATCC 50177/Nand II]